MATTRKILCGTPTKHCSGSLTPTSAWLGGAQRAHNSSEDAFRCYARYLVGVLGGEQVGGREFRLPEGNELGVSGVLVLTKKSRFGGELRPGKSGEKTQGKRFEPKARGKRTQSGLVF